MIQKLCIWSFISIVFLSCKPDEILLQKPDVNKDNLLISLSMQSNYEDQVWFCLAEGKEVYRNKKMAWDIQFSCIGNNYIFLNSSLVMKASVTNFTNWTDVNSGNGLKFTHDHSSGNKDSLAIGKAEDVLNKIIVIDRGFDVLGNPLGLIKFQVKAVNNQKYTIQFGAINSTTGTEVEIIKNPDYATVSFSLNDAKTLLIEPMPAAYDIVFTQYTHSFYNPYTPYLVTGVLSNRKNTKVAEITTKAYELITLEDTKNLVFTDSLDAIGYDWKTYSFDTQSFTTHSQKVYIIQTQKNDIFKLQFLDFYNDQGIKGHPLFNLQQL